MQIRYEGITIGISEMVEENWTIVINLTRLMRLFSYYLFKDLVQKTMVIVKMMYDSFKNRS